EFRKRIENLLDKKNKELAAHETSKPAVVAKPENDPAREKQIAEISEAIAKAKEALLAEETNIVNATQQQARLVQLIATADRLTARLDNLNRQVQSFINESTGDFTNLGLPMGNVFSATIDKTPLTERRKVKESWVVEQSKRSRTSDPIPVF